MSNTNPFAKFSLGNKTLKVKSLGNATVTIRELSISEEKELHDMVVPTYDENGKPHVDYNAIGEAKLIKVSMSLVEPTMTVEELKALSGKAVNAIDEIANEVDKLSQGK